jgi:transcriptional regulator with XRE-family HTH domain
MIKYTGKDGVNMKSNESMANFILELRKSKNMTQKQLAEKLNVTDKAISKWERGLGYPDITILSSLADILGVTTNELLNGHRDEVPNPKVDADVENALKFADQVITKKRKTARSIIKFGMSITFLIAIITCMICDLAITHSLTWSWYVISSVVFTWLMIMPLILFEKPKIALSLLSFSIFIIPFLFALQTIIGNIDMMTLSLPVSAASVGFMWIIYGLFMLKKISKWYAAAITLVLCIPFTVLINYIMHKILAEPVFDVWDVLSFGILAVVAVVFACLGYFSNKNESPRP